MAEPSIKDFMRPIVPFVEPADSVARVAQLLIDANLPGVPVIDSGELVGIITEGDLITRQADLEMPAMLSYLDAIVELDGGREFDDELRRVLAVTAKELMTAPVVNVRDSATLNEVATLMHERNLNPIPVVNDKLELVGIVSRRDLVQMIAKLESAGGEPDATTS